MPAVELTQFRQELNLRDLGGYIGADGRRVKSGLLFRSGALGQANDRELDLIKQLGLRYVLDLRCKEEADELPDPEIPGARQLRISGAMDANDNEINLSPKSLYRILFNPRRVDPDPEESVIAAIAEIYTSLAFRNLAYQDLMKQLESAAEPVLFHCTCGKDRTGVAAIVILMALGVDEETLVRDFVLTNEYLQPVIDAKLAKHPFLARFRPYQFFVRVTEGVMESFGRRVPDEICQEYGSFEVYLEKEFGLAGERLQRFRDMYLEPAEA